MSGSGLLRGSAHEVSCSWDEVAVWEFFTEVLRRLGPARVDPARLYVTGISLGAAGAWHLALRFGNMLAAVVPISGRCAWPDKTWPRDSDCPEEVSFKNLQAVALRAYQTDKDRYAGNPANDIKWLAKNLDLEKQGVRLPGMDEGSECEVTCHGAGTQKVGQGLNCGKHMDL